MKAEFFMTTDEDCIMEGIAKIRKEYHGFDIPKVDKYIAKNPEKVIGYVAKASLLGSEKKFEEAHKLLDEADKKFEHNGLLHHIRATIYENQGRREDALMESRIATELNPYSPEIRLTLGTLLNRAGKYDEAIEVWQDILKVDPKMGAAWNSLAKAEFEKGDYRKAINHTTSAMMLSENTWAYYAFLQNRSQIHLMNGDLEKALEDDKQVLEQDLQAGIKHILTQPEFAAKGGRPDLASRYVNEAMSKFPVLTQIFAGGVK